MTEKQRKFIDAFLGPAGFNATAAARIAGYRWPSKQGSAVARHPAVHPVIEREFAEIMKAIEARGRASRRGRRRGKI